MENKMIYLNNASTSFPKPDSVINEVVNYLKNVPNNYGRGSTYKSDYIKEVRDLIKNFFNANDDYFNIFTSGSTESLNLVIKGLNLENKEVIITANEHNSVIRPLKYLENKGKINLNIVDIDSFAEINLEHLNSLITEKTALVVINAISNVTGTVQNLLEIAKILKQRNILLLIDGSQLAGNYPINLNEINADFFAYTGHKSLFGMQGIGGLIFKKNINFEPLKNGGTGFRSNYLYQPEELPHYYESGTQNIPGIISLKKGIDFINEVGLENIIKHKEKLMNTVINNLKYYECVKIYKPETNYSNSVLSFTIDKITPEELSYILKNSFDIEVRAGLHCCPLIHKYLGTEKFGTIRISPSYFTTEDEIDTFNNAISKIIEEFK
jgi:cysteine desulfurase family protein